MMRFVGPLAALVLVAFLAAPPARRLVAGHRYRATFDAPLSLLGALGPLQQLFPAGAALHINAQKQIVAEFVAVKDAELDDPSTPEKGDLVTPLGALKLRRLERLD